MEHFTTKKKILNSHVTRAFIVFITIVTHLINSDAIFYVTSSYLIYL